MNIRAIYVAAPYDDAARVRALHERLVSMGIDYTSRWAVRAAEPTIGEDAAGLTPEQWRTLALNNDRDIQRADALLVLSRDKTGGEMYCEARFALVLGLPVFWVGRRVLSAWREGVIRCEDLDDALTRIASGSPRRNP